MSFRLSRLTLLAVPALGLLTACEPPPPVATGAGRGDAAASAYCRQRAEEVYSAQHRSARIQTDNRDTPFSGSYVPSVTSRGLADRHALDMMIADCIRNASNRDVGADPAVALAAPAPAAPAPAAARPAGATGGGTPTLAKPAERAQGVPLERAPPPPRP